MDNNDLRKKAIEIRKELLTLIYSSKTGHTGGGLSSTDILTVLYYKIMNISSKNPKWEDRDRFILSKGHCVEPLYCILCDLGYFSKDELYTFSKFGSKYIGHPNNKVNGIEMNTGALGHGLSISTGMALAGKINKKEYKVFTLMGDGELAEGSVWEAAMAASNYKLDNLIAIIDRNGLQISGSTEDVMKLDSLEDKWKAFGWRVLKCNGNDIDDLLKVFNNAIENTGKPTVIIARTTKGKGVSFMENVASWHHGVPTKEQFEVAMKDLLKEA